MQGKDHYGVQTFVRGHKGRLELGRAIACKNADEARREAQRRVNGQTAVGASAFLRRVASEEFDDGERPVTLEVFGIVPDGVRDELPF